MVPVQIAGSHKRERRAAGSLRGLVYLLCLAGEGVKVDDGGIWFQALGNRYRFAVVVKVYIVRIIRFLL